MSAGPRPISSAGAVSGRTPGRITGPPREPATAGVVANPATRRQPPTTQVLSADDRQGDAAVVSARPRPPTMADVASQAGVSHQTVSRVLGEHPNVRDETRAKVLRVIEEMGYRRNPSARALATRRTRTLGVVASDTTLYGPASTLFALEEAARARGYLVSTVSLRKLTVQTLSEALDHLSEGGVEEWSPSPHSGRRWTPSPDCVTRSRWSPSGADPEWTHRASPWTTTRARRWPPVICWRPATARSGTWPDPRTGRSPPTGRPAGGRPSKQRASSHR